MQPSTFISRVERLCQVPGSADALVTCVLRVMETHCTWKPVDVKSCVTGPSGISSVPRSVPAPAVRKQTCCRDKMAGGGVSNVPSPASRGGAWMIRNVTVVMETELW